MSAVTWDAGGGNQRSGYWFGILLLLLASSAVVFAWADPASGYSCYAAVLFLASVWFLVNAVRNRSMQLHWMATVLVMCAGWGSLQAAAGLTVYRRVTVVESVSWLAAAAVFHLSSNCLSQGSRLVLLRRYATSFGGVLSVLTVLCWYTAGGTILWIIPTEYAAENAGTFLNRDQYAVLIELLLPIALARSIQSGRVLPPYCLAAAAMYASVLVTASRAGTILVTLELIIFLVLACCRIERGFVAAAVIGGCALAVTAVFGPEYVIQRFQTADPFTFRREMLLSTWQMIQTKWLTGFGLGTWPTMYPAFAVFDPPGLFMNHAHNDWAEWTADGGIVFTAAIASVAAGAAWISRTSVWSMGVSIAFLHALVDFPFHKPALVICAFLILGASVTPPQREKGAITKQKVHRHTERNISEL